MEREEEEDGERMKMVREDRRRKRRCSRYVNIQLKFI